MLDKFMLFIFICLVASLSYATAKTPSVPGANVYIISPTHGEVVTSPVVVKFGLRGMGVAPAGAEIKDTGHHHLLIDVESLPELDKPIPSNEHHMHFGKGQTEAVIQLAPGKHTLQLLFADFTHLPHEPVIKSEPIIIHVVE